MSKKADPGELRTRCYFKSISRNSDASGKITNPETNVFGVDDEGIDRYAMVKWVNAHGTEAITALQLKLKEVATLTMRYSPLIKEDLIVYCGDDPKPYEIKSVDNVEMKNEWLELKVQRKVAAR